MSCLMVRAMVLIVTKHDLAFHVRNTTRRKGAFYIIFFVTLISIYTRANSKNRFR